MSCHVILKNRQDLPALTMQSALLESCPSSWCPEHRHTVYHLADSSHSSVARPYISTVTQISADDRINDDTMIAHSLSLVACSTSKPSEDSKSQAWIPLWYRISRTVGWAASLSGWAVSGELQLRPFRGHSVQLHCRHRAAGSPCVNEATAVCSRSLSKSRPRNVRCC